MKLNHYALGQHAALEKIGMGMQLQFKSPQEAAQHAKTRSTVGDVAGFAGNVAGGTLAGMAATPVAGPAGAVAGGIAGGLAGDKLLSSMATTGYDAMHDIPQKTKATYTGTLQRLNAASGMPTGIR